MVEEVKVPNVTYFERSLFHYIIILSHEGKIPTW